MATPKKKVEAAPAATGKVTIADLAVTLKTEARILRAFIRSQGIKAPETKQEGFGPRAKYEWDAGSPELKKILAAWTEATKE